MVLGAPGVGKTRLLDAGLGRVRHGGGRAHQVSGAMSAMNFPLAPFAAMVGPRVGQEAFAEIVRCLVAGSSPGGPPAVLQVDDAHWLDDASVSLVRHLLYDGRIVVAVAARTRAGLPSALTTAFGEVGVDTISLGPLGRSDMAKLVEDALGGPVDGAAMARIVEAGDGNTLYVRELVEGALASGLLRNDLGLWRFEGALSTIPAIQDLVAARLAALDHDLLDVLELVSLAGRLPLEAIEELGAARAFESLERQQLVCVDDDTVTGGISVRPKHPLHGEVMTARLPRLARLRHCARLADLASKGVLGEDAELRTVMWQHESLVPVAPDRLLGAARAASARGDTPLAARLAVAACADELSLEAGLLAATCLAEQGHHDDAIDLLKRLAEVVDEPHARAAVAARMAGELWWAAGDVAGARAVLDAPEPSADLDAPGALRVGQCAVFEMLDGNVERARELVAAVRRHPALGVRSVAAIAEVMLDAATDEGERGAARASETFDEFARSPPPLDSEPGIHLVTRTMALVRSGELNEAYELANFIYQATLFTPGRQARGWAASGRGHAALERGALVDALRDLTESALLWLDCGLQGPASWSAAGAVISAAQLGDTGRLDAATTMLDGLNRSGFRQLELTHRRAALWADAARGHPLDRSVAALLDGLHTHSALTAEVVDALCDIARLGHAKAVRSHVDACAPTSSWATLRLDFARSLADRDADVLCDVSERFEAFGAHLRACEALVHATAVLRQCGEAARASAIDTRARQLIADFGLRGIMLDALNDSFPLSRRELDVAQLAASGLTNARIARRLVVSERTVENHLYRIYGKLGISSRRELPRVMGTRDLSSAGAGD